MVLTGKVIGEAPELFDNNSPTNVIDKCDKRKSIHRQMHPYCLVKSSQRHFFEGQDKTHEPFGSSSVRVKTTSQYAIANVKSKIHEPNMITILSKIDKHMNC